MDDGAEDNFPLTGLDSERSGSERGSDDDDDEDEGTEGGTDKPSASSAFLSKLKSSKKPAAWTDTDDVPASSGVSLAKGHSRLRKLRQSINEDVIDTREYETRLRHQFETVNPEPEWAKKAKSAVKAKKHELDLLSDNSDIGEDEDVLLPSTNKVFADSRRTTRKGEVKLARDILSIERLRDANQSVQNSGSGEVRVATFHPSTSASILCVATADRRIRLLAQHGPLEVGVDGEDAQAEVLQGPGDGVARAVRPLVYHCCRERGCRCCRYHTLAPLPSTGACMGHGRPRGVLLGTHQQDA